MKSYWRIFEENGNEGEEWYTFVLSNAKNDKKLSAFKKWCEYYEEDLNYSVDDGSSYCVEDPIEESEAFNFLNHCEEVGSNSYSDLCSIQDDFPIRASDFESDIKNKRDFCDSLVEPDLYKLQYRSKA